MHIPISNTVLKIKTVKPFISKSLKRSSAMEVAFFMGAKHVDGNTFDKLENRPYQLQIPLEKVQ